MEYSKEHWLNELGDNLRKEYKDIIVDFILYDTQNHQILIQKRSMTRTYFPDTWEFPGGHLEPHETLAMCLKRAVYEEGQMYLDDVVSMVHLFRWDSDKDVINLQLLVDATGKFTPNKDKISQHQYIDVDNIDLLLEDGKESPIYRGAFYAFQYMRVLEEARVDMFESVLFFDQAVTGFSDFTRSKELPPKIVIGQENEKKFNLDKENGILSISPSFLRHYDKFSNALIILRLIFHNYHQNIVSYNDVKSIRMIMGKNIMFYVDIVADVYVYLYLERYYTFDEQKYYELCFNTIKEYQAESLEASKFTRLVGSTLSIDGRVGQAFNVVLPVLDDQGFLHVVHFSKSLRYQRLQLSKNLQQRCTALVTESNISKNDFESTIKKLINVVKSEK